MNRIKSIKQQTKNRFLNMYELEAVHRDGKVSPYFLASRADDENHLKMVTENWNADAVMVYAIIDNKIVLEKQFRYTIDDYIYELPAGLSEKGENNIDTARREFFEETGLQFMPVTGHNSSGAFFTSIGLSDESISTVYGYAEGTPSTENQEDSEDIQIVFADKNECIRILHEEKVSIMCAFLLMHFIHADKDPFYFLV